MIRNLTAGYGIHITNNNYNPPYIDSTRPSAGIVRYHNNSLEIYDGATWMSMQPSHPQVELTSDVIAILHWARDKMAEEARVKKLAATHPAVEDALEAVKQAEEQVKVVVALCKV